MSSKLAKLTPEEKQKQDDEQYMRGRPNRMEVANYVNALLEQKYIPQLQEQTSMGFMVIQALLIEKGICTGEEIEQMTKEFIKQKQAKAQQAQKKSENPKQDK